MVPKTKFDKIKRPTSSYVRNNIPKPSLEDSKGFSGQLLKYSQDKGSSISKAAQFKHDYDSSPEHTGKYKPSS